MDRFTHLVARRRAPGRGRLRHRRRGGGRADRRRGRDRHRRPQVVPGLLRHADHARPDRVSPFSIPAIIPNLGAGWVSIELGTRGPLLSPCTACAASNMAIGDGMDAIRLGRADVMFCGGTEAAVCPVGIAGFGAMRALSRRNDDPERASRPFDGERDGFVMGEAAAMLVLEELEHAKARGAKIYAEVAGYGLSSDAQHITEPDPTGPARAFDMALGDAGVDRGRRSTTSTRTDVDADRRRVRDAGDQERARRGERLQDAGLVDQGRDGPLPRRRRRGRGDVHDARRPRRQAAADDQLRGPGSRVRPRLRPERGARRRRRTWPCRTASASAATTPASSSASTR